MAPLSIPHELSEAQALSARHLADLRKAAATSPYTTDLQGKCLPFATGSIARGEASPGSDLDCFLLHQLPGQPSLDTIQIARAISSLEEVRNQTSLALKPFSQGGTYLVPLSFMKMNRDIGDPKEDGKNYFTARMLLLINSRSLVDEQLFQDLRGKALSQYWMILDRLGQVHEVDLDQPFSPIMFFNDLRRWWLSVALNFELYNRPQAISLRLNTNPAESTQLRVQRRLDSLKLRFPRMLEVPSIILQALSLETDGKITRTDLENILRSTPVERIESTAAAVPALHSLLQSVLDNFAIYMRLRNDATFPTLHTSKQHDRLQEVAANAEAFHIAFYAAYDFLGRQSKLYPYLVI